MTLNFYKYEGTGNDFVIIDDRNTIFDVNDSSLINLICNRNIGVGADGLILLRNHNHADFEMIYFNSDGYQSTMCGNGGRCIVSFANFLKIIEIETIFKACDGMHKAKIIDSNNVLIKMNNVNKIDKVGDGFFLDTGSPHFVKFVNNLDDIDVEKKGKKYSRNKKLSVNSTNVNFVQFSKDLNVRTFERGVERETLSCGTGVVASALCTHLNNMIKSNFININTRGGRLKVYFNKDIKQYNEIWLEGEVRMVFSGKFYVN
tara:strand:+ start:344 stop:1123 length:780 start_codon:yes stop_codon:yes gene_type:complete